jgi:hypothetical protein
MFSKTCGHAIPSLRTDLSGVACTVCFGLLFRLSALCDYALLPRQQEPTELTSMQTQKHLDKFSILRLIQKFASFQPLSDIITLALLRPIWGCSSPDEMRNVARPAQRCDWHVCYRRCLLCHCRRSTRSHLPPTLAVACSASASVMRTKSTFRSFVQTWLASCHVCLLPYCTYSLPVRTCFYLGKMAVHRSMRRG